MSAYNNSNTCRAIKLLNSAYPRIDEQTSAYIAEILDCPKDIPTEDDLFESIGEFLQAYAPDKSEDDIKITLKQVFSIIRSRGSTNEKSFTLLKSPVNLKNKITELDINDTNGVMDMETTLVDVDKLKKEEEKTKQKQIKRDFDDTLKATKNAQKSSIPMQPTLNQVNRLFDVFIIFERSGKSIR